jgi:hypothetical protein
LAQFRSRIAQNRKHALETSPTCPLKTDTVALDTEILLLKKNAKKMTPTEKRLFGLELPPQTILKTAQTRKGEIYRVNCKGFMLSAR